MKEFCWFQFSSVVFYLRVKIFYLFLSYVYCWLSLSRFDYVIIALIFIVSLTLRKKYSNQWIETLETITCVSGLVFYLILIPGYYVELLKANLSISIIIVSIFCYSTFTNWLGSFRQDSLSFLESISKTKE